MVGGRKNKEKEECISRLRVIGSKQRLAVLRWLDLSRSILQW
jgi:hypothetical protein